MSPESWAGVDANQGHHAYAWWPIQTPGDIQISSAIKNGPFSPTVVGLHWNPDETGIKQVTILDEEPIPVTHQRNGNNSAVPTGVFHWR